MSRAISEELHAARDLDDLRDEDATEDCDVRM